MSTTPTTTTVAACHTTRLMPAAAAAAKKTMGAQTATASIAATEKKTRLRALKNKALLLLRKVHHRRTRDSQVESSSLSVLQQQVHKIIAAQTVRIMVATCQQHTHAVRLHNTVPKRVCIQERQIIHEPMRHELLCMGSHGTKPAKMKSSALLASSYSSTRST